MSNFKHPQYLTPGGLKRMKKRPFARTLIINDTEALSPKPVATEIKAAVKTEKISRIRLLAEKRILARRALQRRSEGLSEDAAKVLAEAIKTLLRS